MRSAVALGAPLAVAALLSAFRDDLSSANVVLVLVLVVVAVAATGSRAAGVVAALSSAVWFDFFLTEPYLTFTIADRDDVETAVLLTLVGLAVTEIALWGRRQQARSSRTSGYLDGVVSAAGLVAAGEVPRAAVLDVVCRQVVEVLGIDACDYVAGAPSGAHPVLERDGSVTRAGRPVAVDRSGLPSDDVVELPVVSHGAVVGRLVLTASGRVAWPSPEQRRVAVALADQVGPVAAG
jgi:K+-sensing histidine kinase KdpD